MRIVVAIDIHDSRLALAKQLGATHTINARSTDTAKELLRITGDQGVNYILDTRHSGSNVVGGDRDKACVP